MQRTFCVFVFVCLLLADVYGQNDLNIKQVLSHDACISLLALRMVGLDVLGGDRRLASYWMTLVL